MGRKGIRATGIVRRIDSLGRIVIPKEIRRTMKIREGDSLEIYVDPEGEGGIFLIKYSPIEELGKYAENYANLLFKTINVPVIISDRERVVAASTTIAKNDIVGKPVSGEFDRLMQKRKTYKSSKDSVLYPVQNVSCKGLVCTPIISYGDLIGSVILVDEKGEDPNETQIKLAQFVATFLGEQLSE